MFIPKLFVILSVYFGIRATSTTIPARQIAHVRERRSPELFQDFTGKGHMFYEQHLAYIHSPNSQDFMGRPRKPLTSEDDPSSRSQDVRDLDGWGFSRQLEEDAHAHLRDTPLAVPVLIGALGQRYLAPMVKYVVWLRLNSNLGHSMWVQCEAGYMMLTQKAHSLQEPDVVETPVPGEVIARVWEEECNASGGSRNLKYILLPHYRDLDHDHDTEKILDQIITSNSQDIQPASMTFSPEDIESRNNFYALFFTRLCRTAALVAAELVQTLGRKSVESIRFVREIGRPRNQPNAAPRPVDGLIVQLSESRTV